MTSQSKLSQYCSNKVRFEFENTQPLSTDQIIVSNHVLELFETPSDMPKTIQLIAQPQSGKTNTVINMVSLIHLSSKSKSECNLYYFQPSDNELKAQVSKRFNLRYNVNVSEGTPGRSFKMPQIFNGVHTPTNITGLSSDLIKSIEEGRENGDAMIFIHDESHHSVGTIDLQQTSEHKKKKELAKLTNFFKENNIMFGSEHASLTLVHSAEGPALHEVNKNHNNEIYINISASPADLMKYGALCIENNLKPFVKCYYLKPHANYLSFKDIAEQNRFKQCFEINNRKGTVDNVRRFMVSIVCQHLLLAEPGCLIVRLNPGAGSDLKIRDMIKSYNSHPDLLISDLNEFLDPALNTPDNLAIIKTNLQKLNTLSFDCYANKKLSEDLKQLEKDYPIISDDQLAGTTDADEKEKKLIQNEHNRQELQPREFKLIDDCRDINVEIGTIDYFMKDQAYQQGEYRILCITNSFLQGKTFKSLDRVRGWFDRDRDEDVNNAFTIQSIGRNCGNHKNRNYTYPIWTNVDEINRMIQIYENFENNSDDYGLINPDIFADPSMAMTSTNTKLMSVKEKKEFFRNRHMSGICNENWEADFFASKTEAENWIIEKLAHNHPQAHFTHFGKDAHGISVSKNNSNNVLGDMVKCNYGRYRKDDGHGQLYPYGLIYLDDLNASSPKHIDTWTNTIQNPDSPFFDKQNYYIAFVERNPEEIQKLKDDMNKEVYTRATSGWQLPKSNSTLPIIKTTKPIIEQDQKNILDELAQLRQQLEAITRQLSQ